MLLANCSVLDVTRGGAQNAFNRIWSSKSQIGGGWKKQKWVFLFACTTKVRPFIEILKSCHKVSQKLNVLKKVHAAYYSLHLQFHKKMFPLLPCPIRHEAFWTCKNCLQGIPNMFTVPQKKILNRILSYKSPSWAEMWEKKLFTITSLWKNDVLRHFTTVPTLGFDLYRIQCPWHRN
jgi:hypothetical protein